jgi:hypothetical protein
MGSAWPRILVVAILGGAYELWAELTVTSAKLYADVPYVPAGFPETVKTELG